ncbi:BatD family protein [soil metagenome]
MINLVKSPNKLSLLWLLPLLLVLSIAGMAQAPFLSATASKSTVGVGEQFQLTYTLNTKGSNFRGPDLSAFAVLSGPNTSQSVQLINGSFSQSLTFSFILQAKTEGNFKISPAGIEVEGKKIVSNIVNLAVVKGNPSSAQNNQKGQQQSGESGLSDKNIFIRANVNKQSVIQGEAVVISFKLYTNVNIVNYSVKKMPPFNGFWNQDIELPQQLDLSTEVVDGISYRTGEIKKVVLFPQKSGVLTIDPMEIECIARVQVKQDRRSDPFGMFNDPFFGMGARDVNYEFKSNSLKINVKALPSNAPASFTGSVGRMDFSATLDKKETKENEPVTLKLKISGSGNLKLSEAPTINFPQDLETYDPKITENLKVSTGGVTGSKSIEYLLIPRHEGSYTLEPIEFTYFDLDKNQYITKKSGPFNIQVARGKGGSAVISAGGTEKSDFQVIGKDIRYIKVKDTEFTSRKSGFYGSLPFYALTITPLLMFAGFVSYRRRQEKLMSNVTLLKSKNATIYAKKRLTSAEKLLNGPQQSGVYDEVSKALWGYVSDKLSIPVSELTKENAGAAMQIKNAKLESVDEWLQVLQSCELARYGGVAAAGEPSQIYERAIRLITKLEGELHV